MGKPFTTETQRHRDEEKSFFCRSGSWSGRLSLRTFYRALCGLSVKRIPLCLCVSVVNAFPEAQPCS